jgi:hypothetical protein
MTRWEYTHANLDPASDPVREINQLGAEGWEVCAYEPESKDHHGVFFLKRPVPRQMTPQMKIGGWHLCNQCNGIVTNGESCPSCTTARKP